MSDLTRDNSHYHVQRACRQSFAASDLQLTAQISKMLPNGVREFLAESISDNSRRAYSSDLAKFLKWGGRLPSDPIVIASYLADHGKTHAVSTLRRWVASLSKAHSSAGHPDPTRLEPARSTLRGICRSRKERTSCAMPLLKDDLFAVLGVIGNTVRDRRDRSLLLVGFAAGFRRSELTGLDVEDVNFVRRGMIITLRRSKTDQTNLGRDIAIPFGKSQYCPVRELEEWLATAEISSGPLYRSVRRNGSISEKRLSAEAVSGIIKQRVAACGYDPRSC